jgi:hypothetical protein
MHKSIIPKLREKFPDKSFFHENDLTEDKFIGEDIIFFNLLKEAGIQAYAHTGALVTHMKTFPFDISYYALFWTAYNKVQDDLKKDDLCPSCEHKPSDVVKDCKCCNRGEDNE